MIQNNHKICVSCGHENPLDALECSNCGMGIQAGTTKTIPQQQRGKGQVEQASQLSQLYQNALVLFIMGEDRPVLLKGKGQFSLGRATPGERPPSVDLTEYEGASRGVSRQHAIISYTLQGYLLEDLNSTNGTWLNETRLIAHKPYNLHSGDQLRLGQIALQLYFSSETSTERTIFLVETDESKVSASRQRLTPDYLSRSISPILDAIARLQYKVDTLSGRIPFEIGINALTVNIPDANISVSIDGAIDSINLIGDTIIPWKKQRQRLIATADDPKRNRLHDELVDLAHTLALRINPALSDKELENHIPDLLSVLDALVTPSIDIITDHDAEQESTA